MRNRIKDGILFVEPVRKAPSHACTEKAKQFLYSHMLTWNSKLEQGFPCPHLRMKHYFVSAIDEEKTTFNSLQKDYVAAFNMLSPEEKDGSMCMKYSTFTQYVHEKMPGLRLCRTKQDVCAHVFGWNLLLKIRIQLLIKKNKPKQSLICTMMLQSHNAGL